MNEKIPKKEQTYEWALEQMSYFHNNIRLTDISKKHWTDELLTAALLFCNANLKDIPKDRLTRPLCEAALMSDAFSIGNIPDKYKDYDLLFHAVSSQPAAFDAAFYELRKGRAGEPFSEEDIRLAMEAVSPQAFGDVLIEEYRNSPVFTDEEERRKWIAVNAPCGRSLPKTMMYEALQALLEKRQAEASNG